MDYDDYTAWMEIADCHSAIAAEALAAAGITPEEAALVVDSGKGDYAATIGYKVAQGDLSVDEALEEVTQQLRSGAIMRTLRGFDAVEVAQELGIPLHKYADPTESARDGLTVSEALEICAEDPNLIWVEVND